MSDITDRVKKIVVEHLNVDESKVSDEASFIDDLGADSLDTVELVMAFEEAFDVEIPDETIPSGKVGAPPTRLFMLVTLIWDIASVFGEQMYPIRHPVIANVFENELIINVRWYPVPKIDFDQTFDSRSQDRQKVKTNCPATTTKSDLRL